jgi:hypothetical protein
MDESNELAELIQLAKRCAIHFVYALSPGLDLGYSSDKDLDLLKRKFDQVRRTTSIDASRSNSFALF